MTTQDTSDLSLEKVWRRLTAPGIPIALASDMDVPDIIMIHGGQYSAADFSLMANFIRTFVRMKSRVVICSFSHWGGAFTPHFDDRFPSEGAYIMNEIWRRHPWDILKGTPVKPRFVCDGRARNTPEEVLCCAEMLRLSDWMDWSEDASTLRLVAITVDAHALRLQLTYREQTPELEPVILRPGQLFGPEWHQRLWDEASRCIKYSDKGDIASPDDGDRRLFLEMMERIARPE